MLVLTGVGVKTCWPSHLRPQDLEDDLEAGRAGFDSPVNSEDRVHGVSVTWFYTSKSVMHISKWTHDQLNAVVHVAGRPKAACCTHTSTA